MSTHIYDKEIDRKLKQLVENLKDYGIRNVSKADALRWLLAIKKQGKKTNRRWKGII